MTEQFERPTLAQVQRWVMNARPGAELVYGQGVTCRPGPAVTGAADEAVADWLMEQARKGFVALVQRRNRPQGTVPPFLYVAQRCAKRWDPDAPLPVAPAPLKNLNRVRDQALRSQITRVFA